MVNYPDYRAKTVVELSNGKERWVEIGVAFNNRDTITVKLDALPINGKVILVPIRDDKKDDRDSDDRTNDWD